MSSEANIVADESNEISDTIDIHELLEFANSKTFDDEKELVARKKSFEKVASFFELIKSEKTDEIKNEIEQNSEENEEIQLNSDDPNESIENSKADQLLGSETLSSDVAKSESEIEKDFLSADDEAFASNEDSVDEIEEKNTPENEFEPVDFSKATDDIEEEIPLTNENSEDEISEEVSPEYERGYNEALKEFEQTLVIEKKLISDFGQTILSARNEAAKIVEELISEKVREIAHNFLGHKIDTLPDEFIEQVKTAGKSIVSQMDDFVVEFNEIDAASLKENANLEDFNMKIKEVTDLNRGEFRLKVGKSGYEQRVLD